MVSKTNGHTFLGLSKLDIPRKGADKPEKAPRVDNVVVRCVIWR